MASACSGPACAHCTPDPPDHELIGLLQQIAATLSACLGPEDAALLARADEKGQSLPEIAAATGLSEAEIAERLKLARACLCRLVALALSPAAPA